MTPMTTLFLPAGPVNWNSPGARRVTRMTTPKPNYNQAEVDFIRAIFELLPKSERHKYRYYSPSETSVAPGDPWRQLRIGSRVIRAKMSRDWTHAGRVYELTVEKEWNHPEDWSWEVMVTNSRRPSYKPVAQGKTLESLHAWAGEKYPNADLPALLPTTEPVPINWAQVKYRERRALGLA